MLSYNNGCRSSHSSGYQCVCGSEPDDFDIPVCDDVHEYYENPDIEIVFNSNEQLGYKVKGFKRIRKQFVWTDRQGVPHKLVDMDDQYVSNVIGFLKRELAGMPVYDADPYTGDVVSTEQDADDIDSIIKLFSKELEFRRKG